VQVIEGLDFETPATGKLVAVLAACGLEGKRVLIGTVSRKNGLCLSARNLKKVEVSAVSDFNTLDVLQADCLLLERDAFDLIESGEFQVTAEQPEAVDSEVTEPEAAAVEEAVVEEAAAEEAAAEEAVVEEAAAEEAVVEEAAAEEAAVEEAAAEEAAAEEAEVEEAAAEEAEADGDRARPCRVTQVADLAWWWSCIRTAAERLFLFDQQEAEAPCPALSPFFQVQLGGGAGDRGAGF
jgi:hypothetical protein